MSNAQDVLPSPARDHDEWAADVRREPVVPWDPASGWAKADLLRRSCAVAALPLTALFCTLVSWTSGPAVVAMWAWMLVGPATFYALARVLRPEPRSWERTSRHVLAGAGAAFGIPTVLALVAPEGTASGGVVILFGSAAFSLAVITIVWALFAWVVRERRY